MKYREEHLVWVGRGTELGLYKYLVNISNSVIIAVGWGSQGWFQNAGFPVLMAKHYPLPSLALRL